MMETHGEFPSIATVLRFMNKSNFSLTKGSGTELIK